MENTSPIQQYRPRTYLTSRYLRVDRGAIAALLFYVIGPMVVFSATISVEINLAVLFLPIFFYLFSSSLCFIYLKLFQKQWCDSISNILAFTAGTGNTAYYGIALALMLFEPAVANIFIFTILASFLYEATCGFILLDKTFVHLLYDDLYKVMFVFAIVPLAGNTVTLAVLLNAQPEKAALAVLLSNLLSIIYIPMMLLLYEFLWPLV